MADADVRWLERLENYERALASLERALTLAASRPLSELEQQGLIQAFEFTHELSWLLWQQRIPPDPPHQSLHLDFAAPGGHRA